jgi:hypothetical protein
VVAGAAAILKVEAVLEVKAMLEVEAELEVGVVLEVGDRQTDLFQDTCNESRSRWR